MSIPIVMPIQIRRGTATAWSATNPVLLNSEMGRATDTGVLKIGDGVTAWNALPAYVGGVGPTGPTGPAGADSVVPGPTGPTGPAGSDANVTNVNVNAAIATSPATTRTSLGLGTAALSATGDFATAGHTHSAVIAGGASGFMIGSDKTKLDAISGTNTGDQTTISGLAGSATILATGRTIGSTGDVVFTTASFNGSANATGVAAIQAGVVTLAMQANMATGSLVYRKTALAGAPEVQTLATLKTDLGLTGTNSGDQTNISGNAGTVTTNANLTGHITSTGNAAVLGSFTTAQLNTALSDADVATGGGTATGTNTGDQNLAAYATTAAVAAGYQPLDAQLTDFAGLAYAGNSLKVLRVNAGETGLELVAAGGGSGTVTSVSVTTAAGVSGSVATATTTPAITITLGAITPTSVAASGTVTGSNLSGTNTGDQTTVSGLAGSATILATGRTIGITGDMTWSSGSFNGSANVTAAGTLATVNSNVGTFGSATLVPVVTVNAKGLVTAVSTVAVSGGGSDPWTYIKMTADDATDSATFVDVFGFSFTPAINSDYIVEFGVMAQTPTATVGVRMGFSWSANLAWGSAVLQTPTSATAEALVHARIGNTASTAQAAVGGLPVINVPYLHRGVAQFRTGAGAQGAFKVQWASETALTIVTAKQGSFMRYRTI